MGQRISLSSGIRLTQFSLFGPYVESQYDSNNIPLSTNFFDKNDLVVSYFNPEPRFGLNYKLGANSSFKVSYARLFQYIQNIYNTNTPLPTSRWKISDRYILPQKNDTYGLGFYKNYPDSFIELSLESYYRKTENNLTKDSFVQSFLSSIKSKMYSNRNSR